MEQADRDKQEKKAIKEKKDKKGRRRKIIDCAWELFNEKGYDKTTVNDIIRASGTSKGGFYYYFRSKDELLNSLHIRFDEIYRENYEKLPKDMNNYDKLFQVVREINQFIEDHVGPEMLRALYIYELKVGTKTDFLSEERYYFKMMREIIQMGQNKGEISKNWTEDQLVDHILNLERGEMFTWCVAQGTYSLATIGTRDFEMHFRCFKGDN